jgi:hypothetical protein
MTDRLFHVYGLPLIQRELHHWRRWFVASSVVTGLVALANVAYYLQLQVNSSAFGRWTSPDEMRFLAAGVDGIAAHLEWILVPSVAVALCILAPALACLTVMREARMRTLDSLIVTPLPPAALHNGFTLGALARVAPWVAPPLMLHLALGAAGLVSVWTVVETTVALLVAGWGLTSLGAMIGGLLRDTVRGSVVSLFVFGGLAAACAVPLVFLGGNDDGVFTMLSPIAAVIHSLATDPNPILSHDFHQLSALYPGRFLGMWIAPAVFSMAISTGLGLVTTHVGIRRFRDPLAPPVSRRVALAAMLGVTLVGTILFAQKMPSSELINSGWLDLSDARGFARGYLGRQIKGLALGLACLCLPFAVLLGAGSATSSAFRARSSLWDATRPEDVGGRRANMSTAAHFAGLAMVPLALGFLAPWLVTALPMSRVEVGLGHWALTFVPFLWGLVGVYAAVEFFQLSQGHRLRDGLLCAFVATLFAVVGIVYSAVIVSESHLTLQDFAYGGGALHLLVSAMILLSFAVGPLIVLGVVGLRRTRFRMSVMEQLGMVQRPEELPDEPFRWPAPAPDVEVMAALRHDLDGQEIWLELHQGRLRQWRGSAAAGADAVEIDLEGPFHVTAALQPDRHATQGVHHSAVCVLNLTVAAGETRISFALPVEPTRSLLNLPRQDQRLPRLGPRDSDAFLGGLRFHACAGGVPLPL